MDLFWKVCIYRDNGDYYLGQIKTGPELREIDTIQEFYHTLTGCKMLLIGMQETAFKCNSITAAFTACWKKP